MRMGAGETRGGLCTGVLHEWEGNVLRVSPDLEGVRNTKAALVISKKASALLFAYVEIALVLPKANLGFDGEVGRCPAYGPGGACKQGLCSICEWGVSGDAIGYPPRILCHWSDCKTAFAPGLGVALVCHYA